MENKFCCYLTVYRGNKLPPFYLGSTTVEKIKQGYHGSVASWQYKKLWRDELFESPHLFKTVVLATFKTRKDAFGREQFLQRNLNVVRNSLYCNQSVAGIRFTTGTKISLDGRARISASRSGTPLSETTKKRIASSLSKFYREVGTSPATRQKLSLRAKGKKRPAISKALTGKSCKEETKRKISEANRNPSAETRLKKSTGVRAALQKSVYVITQGGILSSWLSLESIFDAYGIFPTSLRRTYKSAPLRSGRYAGWQLVNIIPRTSLPKNSKFLSLGITRIGRQTESPQ
jgi:NUMOD3 motif